MSEQKKKLIHRLRYKYRLVLINDESFEEKFSFKLTPMNLFVAFSSMLVIIAFLTISVIFYTPLKEYVPGYTNSETKRNIKQLLYKTDSLTDALKAKESYYQNIINIINGGTGIGDTTKTPLKKKTVGDIGSRKNEEKFIQDFEKQQTAKSATVIKKNKSVVSAGLSNLFFINPAEGLISNAFNPVEEHFAVDIASKYNSPVKAITEGTVILSGWMPQTGNTLAVQHKNNLVTVYKHNASILKKVGNFVNAGEVIALVGNSGEYTTGAHLHFEMWENGKVINPAEYLNLN